MPNSKTRDRLLSEHAGFIQRMTDEKLFRLSRILKFLHKRSSGSTIIKNPIRREEDTEKALEEDRQTYKTQWMELGFDWDDENMYPSNSDSSITEGSDDEAPPAEAAKKEIKLSEAMHSLDAPAWTVGARCMAKYAADGRFYPAEVVNVAPNGIKVSFLDYDDELQVCAANDLKAFTKAPLIHARPLSLKQDSDSKDAPRLEQRSLVATNTTSSSPSPADTEALARDEFEQKRVGSETVTNEDLEQVTAGDRQLARTITHHINMLYRHVGKRECLLAAVLRAAAKDEHCDVLKRWLDPKPTVVYAAPAQPIVIKADDDDNDNNGAPELNRRRASVTRHAGKCDQGSSKHNEVGWADEDLQKYPIPKNPRNWPPAEEFSSSVLLNQGGNCLSKAAAMECRARKPLEHVEIRIIKDPSNPCYGARGLFATREIPKGRIVCPYMGLYREQTDSNSHYIFNLDFEVQGCSKAAVKKIRLDVDSRASCVGNESKFINDGICLDCVKKIQAESMEDELGPKRNRGTRWFNCPGCRPTNVMACSRLNALLGIPYIAIIAIKKICKNEELLLNYGEQYWRNMLPEEVNSEGKKVDSDLPTAKKPNLCDSAKDSPVPASTAAHPPSVVPHALTEN